MAEISPVVEFPEYEVNPQGGDPLTQNLNTPYDKALCTVLCWQITPAIGFLYGGMHRRKSSLTMIFQSLFCACAVGLQFWLYGATLYLSRPTNPIWGNGSLVAFHNLLAQPSMANSDVPDILYAAFGFTFVTATAMILAGAMLERGRLWPSMLFLLCWTTFVYYILAYWEWNPQGWLYKLGLYDFAGSGPVHIASGFSALAWSLMLGKRAPDGVTPMKKGLLHPKPHDPLLMCLGTILIWFGWFAFNGGSTANLSLRSIYVVVNTNFAACGGGLTWALLDYAYTKKFSLVGFCSGIISGLVGITPAAGFVMVYVAPLVGILTSLVCFYTVKYKHLIGVDDGLDIFAIHGVGGYVGDVLTGIFAAKFVPALDGVSGASYEGGWWDQHWRQLGLQLAGATTCAAWSFFVSCLLLFVIDRIPGCRIRVSEAEELRGLDMVYLEDAPWGEDGDDSARLIVHEGESMAGGSGSPAAVSRTSGIQKADHGEGGDVEMAHVSRGQRTEGQEKREKRGKE